MRVSTQSWAPGLRRPSQPTASSHRHCIHRGNVRTSPRQSPPSEGHMGTPVSLDQAAPREVRQTGREGAVPADALSGRKPGQAAHWLTTHFGKLAFGARCRQPRGLGSSHGVPIFLHPVLQRKQRTELCSGHVFWSYQSGKTWQVDQGLGDLRGDHVLLSS